MASVVENLRVHSGVQLSPSPTACLSVASGRRRRQSLSQAGPGDWGIPRAFRIELVDVGIVLAH